MPSSVVLISLLVKRCDDWGRYEPAATDWRGVKSVLYGYTYTRLSPDTIIVATRACRHWRLTDHRQIQGARYLD